MRLATGNLNNNQNELPALINVMRPRQTKAKAQVEAALKQASAEAKVHHSFDCNAATNQSNSSDRVPSRRPSKGKKAEANTQGRHVHNRSPSLHIFSVECEPGIGTARECPPGPNSNPNAHNKTPAPIFAYHPRSVELERDNIQEDEHEGMHGEKEDEALQMVMKQWTVAPTPKPKRRKAGDPLAGWAIELVPGDKTTAVTPREYAQQEPEEFSAQDPQYIKFP
ncbi:hypothetical protein B0H13DRAFT_1893913 [Mycena leptocephala]|nr:hypothetical protein B0H13DRAFT_1893913 [Mycena leptocephala]